MKSQKGFSVVWGLLIVVTVSVIGLAGWSMWQTKSKTTKAPLPASTAHPMPQVQKTPVQNNPQGAMPATGTIAGQASYPSSALPADENICAVSTTDTAKVYCLNVGKDQTINFSLSVPAGTYFVYATAEKELKGKAYYDTYVALYCAERGSSQDCSAAYHTDYIPVAVTANTTINGVKPGDWYSPTIQNY